LEDGSGFISVATTRPETMLADMAVAVNPADERYAHLVGKNVRLPITGRLIPIVTDEHADPELGSGAVKITPGHDFNDFEVGKRAGFKASDMFNMLDGEGRVVQTADGLIPGEYIGQYRFGIEGEPTNARKMVVEAMDALALLEKVEDRVIQTPFGDRSNQVIEPWLTDQWYVDAETLAKPAIDAARKGKGNGGFDIVPKSWEKTYFNWMENIQPWCVSRQLWWGHQIPAWFAADGTCYVAETEEAAQALAGAGVELTRDPDVLDTWFSSALWPFGTLGWPDESNALNRHYPNDVLISGFDILFFWDARMAMQGIHFMKEVPWKTLYLHGLVRAADGSKMSKSKGNTVDPLGLIDAYGADALRFFMAAMESQGRDIKMDESRVAGYRNFATKLWNAARFAQSNGISGSHSVQAPKAELAVNRWIIGEVVSTVEKLNKAFAEFRFDGMADVLYHMVFDQFCDWYLELIKPAFVDGEKGEMDEESKIVAGWVLDQILVMLHPFMPFITEELWGQADNRANLLVTQEWPTFTAADLVDAEADREMNWVINLIESVRSARAQSHVPAGAKVPLVVMGLDAKGQSAWDNNSALIMRLARIETLDHMDAFPKGCVTIPMEGGTFGLPLAGLIDVVDEISRLEKTMLKLGKELGGLRGRLNNPKFVESAPTEVIVEARENLALREEEEAQLKAAIARLAELG
jgi:valyl-tRNA synthetase